MTTPKTLIAGNWKMNGLAASSGELDAIAAGLTERCGRLGEAAPEALICPPATLIFGFAERARSAQEAGAFFAIGGQDCHPAVSGAHTGDLSAEMLADAGAAAAIVGHSERRSDHGETDAVVKAKAQAALRAGLLAIVCLGESLAEREAGRTLDVITGQLAGSLPEITPQEAEERLVVAYEPVWAIGTGKTPTTPEIAEAHQALRTALEQRFGASGSAIPLLYGGSVKPGNAAEILALEAVNGALIGGASLKAADFLAIYDAA